MQTNVVALPLAARPPVLAGPAAPYRLWPPVLFVALYWAAGFVVGLIDKPYFYGFIYGMASTALLALAFFGWWWTRRRIRLADRLRGFLLVVVGAAVVAPLVHASLFWFGLVFFGLPVVLTVWAVWLVLAGGLSLSPNGAGALAVVLLTWGSFTLGRIDGMDASLRGEYRWRWAPTREDRARAEREARGEGAGEEAASPGARPLSAGAGDWVAFRGPERSGVVRGVKVAGDWSASPPRLVWKRSVGPAWSSVLVVGDRLFTQEQRDGNEAVVCFDARTGDQRWAHEYPARFEETVSNVGPRATPTFADGRLYALGATGVLTCLDAATGKRLWSREITADAQARPPRWGYSGSPLVVGARVVVFAGGQAGKGLLAYDTRTGDLAWGAAVGQDSYSSPQLTTVDGVPQVLMLADRGLTAVAPATGEVLWQHGTAMPGAPRAVQAHALGRTHLVVGTLAGPGVARVEVTRAGGWKVTEQWATAALRPEFPDFVVHEGHAYGFDNGILCCIELEGGERKWKEGRYGRGQVLLLADQPALVVLTEKGQAVLLAANPERREELGRFQALEGKTWNHPVLAGGRLYARNADWLACYDLAGE